MLGVEQDVTRVTKRNAPKIVLTVILWAPWFSISSCLQTYQDPWGPISSGARIGTQGDTHVRMRFTALAPPRPR